MSFSTLYLILWRHNNTHITIHKTILIRMTILMTIHMTTATPILMGMEVMVTTIVKK